MSFNTGYISKMILTNIPQICVLKISISSDILGRYFLEGIWMGNPLT